MMIQSEVIPKRLSKTDKDDRAVTQFLVAAALKKFSTVRFYVEEAGLHPDTTAIGKPTPLSYAVLQQDRCMMQYLIFHGADVNKADRQGMTPLHYATLGGCCYCMAYLIKSGACVNKANNTGKTPLSLTDSRIDLLPSKALLKKHGADLFGGLSRESRFH